MCIYIYIKFTIVNKYFLFRLKHIYIYITNSTFVYKQIIKFIQKLRKKSKSLLGSKNCSIQNDIHI